MENSISPSPAARISPSHSGDEKNSADPRARKSQKQQPTVKKSPAPPAIEIAERDDQHQLDERA
jgi:hypothetical protein